MASEDVTVTLLERGIIILAKNITASMKGLKFAFKKQTFPYVKGSGTADAIGTDVTFILSLDIVKAEQVAFITL